jgi:hypothetical protein
MGYSHRNRKKPLFLPEEVRQRIKATQLVNRLQAHIFDGLELSMSQVRGIEILLRKCIPDLTAVAVKADITHRYVAELPPMLTREEWLKKYGNGEDVKAITTVQ